MAFARVAWWKMKSGKRDEAMKRMDGFLDEAKATKGYRGLISLASISNPDRITVISFWDSEDGMRDLQSGVYQKVVSALSDIIDGPPQVANQEVHVFDMPKIMA